MHVTQSESTTTVTRSGDDWVPACGGTEKPFLSRSGKRLLYCWQPSTGRHAYLDCDSDIIMTDEEAQAAMQLDVNLVATKIVDDPEKTAKHLRLFLAADKGVDASVIKLKNGWAVDAQGKRVIFQLPTHPPKS